MTQLIKPRALKKGDLVGIVAPASPPWEESHVQFTIAWLDKLGLRAKFGKYLFQRHSDHAGTDEERLSDLHRLWSDPEVSAILSMRGGHGSVKLLPHLDFSLLKQHPKSSLALVISLACSFPSIKKQAWSPFTVPRLGAILNLLIPITIFAKLYLLTSQSVLWLILCQKIFGSLSIRLVL